MRRRILLARHGETAWNALGRLQGSTDIVLNDSGRAQARSLATTLEHAGITAVWTSDLARSHETGSIIATALALPAPSIEPDLRERRFGVFEGLTRDECLTNHPDAWRAWTAHTIAPPGGESRDDTVARMSRALRKIAEAHEEPVLVISHGGIMRLWLMELIGSSVPQISNGMTFHLEHDGRSFRARPWRP